MFARMTSGFTKEGEEFTEFVIESR